SDDGIPAGAVDAFLRGLAVAHIPDSRIVEIRFTSSDAAYAARAGNAHTQSYLAQTIELAHAASAPASDWLLKQIDEQKARVAAGDASLAQYQQAHGALEQQKTIGAQRLSELNGAVLRAREARVARETAYRQLAQAKEAGRPLRDLAALVATPL